jgi:hypothetical protein
MPAPDIAELIDQLRATHREGDLYRGQLTDYPTLVPSSYRRGIVAGSEHEPVVRIDGKRVLDRNQRDSRRWKLMNELIGDYGLGLGNLLAQQYGLTSECIDVTEEPSTAAFFATRAWPEYAHHESEGVGVIYRFRNPPTQQAPSELSFDTLGTWMEMGALDGVLFDSFVPDDKLIGTFDRDHWFRWQEGAAAEMTTLPLTIRWSEILAMVAADDPPPYARRRRAPISLREWRISRVAAQHGGFMRPRFFWKAEVPSRFETVHSLGAMQEVYSPGATDRRPELLAMDDGMPWPRAVPSLAFKKEFIGVENLRLRPECEAFPFRHSPRRVTGFYRRRLWPEPSEDPVYAHLWVRAMPHVMAAFRENEMRAVDDPEHGLLDRGYRVRGELQTLDARELDDLARGELEDAREALAFAKPSASHHSRECIALIALGEYRSALAAALRAVRADRDSAEAVISLGSALSYCAKGRWAELAWRRGLELAPEHAVALHCVAEWEINRGEWESAAANLKLALERLDELPYRYSEYRLLESLALAAGVVGDEETMKGTLIRLAKNLTPVDEELLRLEIDRIVAARRKGGDNHMTNGPPDVQQS